MVLQAQRYLKLVGATLEHTGKDGHVVEVSVTLNTVPVRSARFWFPIAHLRNYGPDQLFAAEWIIEKRNQALRKTGETATIRVDHAAGFMA